DGEGWDQDEVSHRNEHRYEGQRPTGAEAGQGAGRPAADTLNDDDGPGARGRRSEGREWCGDLDVITPHASPPRPRPGAPCRLVRPVLVHTLPHVSPGT